MGVPSESPNGPLSRKFVILFFFVNYVLDGRYQLCFVFE